MGWRVVYIKDSQSIKLKLSNLEILKGDEKYYIPLSDINIVVIEGNNTLTTNIITAFSENNIALIICNRKYMPTTLMLNYGGYHHFAKRSTNQAQWTTSLKMRMWESIVKQKMVNQVKVAKALGVSTDRLQEMNRLISQLEIGDRTNREGIVSKVYFNSIYGMQYKRSNEDLIQNMAMDYGYAIIRAAIARAVIGNGMIPVFGIFHKNEFNSFNLVDDLMEPFRPLVDYWISQHLESRREYLDYEFRVKLIEILLQPMLIDGYKSDLMSVIDKYVLNFYYAMEKNNVELLNEIDADNFIQEVER